jgi:hypothetical protein
MAVTFTTPSSVVHENNSYLPSLPHLLSSDLPVLYPFHPPRVQGEKLAIDTDSFITRRSSANFQGFHDPSLDFKDCYQERIFESNNPSIVDVKPNQSR